MYILFDQSHGKKTNNSDTSDTLGGEDNYENSVLYIQNMEIFSILRLNLNFSYKFPW